MDDWMGVDGSGCMGGWLRLFFLVGDVTSDITDMVTKWVCQIKWLTVLSLY